MDDWFRIDGVDVQETAAQPTIREDLPDDDHEVEIVRQGNEEGRLALRLSAVNGRYNFVFLDFYKLARDGSQNTRATARMAALASALGMNADQWVAAVKDGDLVGRRFIATTRQWQQGDRTRVEVDKFSPVPSKPSTATKPARKAAAAKQLETDDIPF